MLTQELGPGLGAVDVRGQLAQLCVDAVAPLVEGDVAQVLDDARQRLHHRPAVHRLAVPVLVGRVQQRAQPRHVVLRPVT